MKTRAFFSTTCPTCTRPSGSPFRVHDSHGKVVNGCVDAFHDDRLVKPSASAFWHARPEARKIRAANKAARMGGVTFDACLAPA